MPLIGINQVNESPRKPSNLEKIAMGVDIAAKILGGGLQAYKTLGPDRELAQAQTANLQSEAQKNMFSGGYIPLESQMGQKISHPQEVQAQAGNDLIDKGFVPADTDQLKIHQDHPDVVKVGGRSFIRAFNPQLPLGELDKHFIDQLKDQNLILTSDKDPEKTGAVYLPQLGVPVTVKKMGVGEKETWSAEDSMSKEFNNLDQVQRFKQAHEAALNAAAIVAKPKVTRSDDLALLTNFIKMQQPNARFNNENVEGVDAAINTTLGQAVQSFKKLWNSHTGLLDPSERNDIISTIQAQYNATRPLYDEAFQAYQNTSKSRGLTPVSTYLRPIRFGGTENTPQNTQSHTQQVPQQPKDSRVNTLQFLKNLGNK